MKYRVTLTNSRRAYGMKQALVTRKQNRLTLDKSLDIQNSNVELENMEQKNRRKGFIYDGTILYSIHYLHINLI